MKKCTKCKRLLPLNLQYWDVGRGVGGYRAYCRRCDAKYKTHYQPKQSAKAWKLKLIALAHYGDACECCGEQEPAFLTFDHVGGGGAEHRRHDRLARKSIVQWLISNAYPPGFRILCFNCHHAIDAGPKHLNRTCPHVYTNSNNV